MINSKQKGNRGELELVKILNKRFDGGFSRTPMSGGFVGGTMQELRKDLSEEAKITLVSDIIVPTDFRFIIEHKFYNEPNFWDLFNAGSALNEWLGQAERDASFVFKEPLVVVKYNNKKRICYLKEKIDCYIFEYKRWYCCWLEDLLTYPDEWWYGENQDMDED